MPYWRFFYIVGNLTDLLKKKQESEDESQDKYNTGDMHNNANKQISQSTKTPKLPSMSAPKFPSMPQIKL